jgi:uncharacterized protein YkwD
MLLDLLRVTPARVATAAGACALTLALAPATPTARAASCSGTDVPVAGTTIAAGRAALACLIDQSRAEHGLPPLRYDDRLARAARAHTDDMVRRRYFAHVTPSGTGVTTRLRAAGFPMNGAWWAGEVLVAASGSLSTPQALMTAWLNSPPHRAILLSPRAARIGIGIARDMPTGAHNANAATVTADLGHLCPADSTPPPDPTSGYSSDPTSDYTSNYTSDYTSNYTSDYTNNSAKETDPCAD